MKTKPVIIISAISLLSALVFSFIIFGSLFYVGNKITFYFNRPLSYFPEILITAVENHIKQPIVNRNFIILGADKRDDAIEKNEMTDTIIFGALSIPNKQLTLVPIPRDFWFEDLQSKVNAIYELSKNNDNNSVDFNFIKKKYSSLLGQNIDYVVVIDTDDLVELVSFVGEVEIYLETGFVDHQYPNPDYITNPSKDIPIYKTIEFPAGSVVLDSQNISEFVRSRKGSDNPATGGTDLGRMARQQLLLDALVGKISSSEIRNLRTLSNLYNFFHNHIETDLTDLDLVQIMLALEGKLDIATNKVEIPVSTHSPEGVILYHPPKFKNNQWVFIPVDPSLNDFQQFIEDSLSADDN